MANNYPVLEKRFAFAAKTETTPGTPETITWNTHGIRLLDIAEPEEGYLAENATDGVVTGTLGNTYDAIPSGKFYRVPIKFALPGAGAAYSASVLPECDPLLRAAGFSSVTIVTTGSSESVTYKLSDDPVSACTAALCFGGKKYVFTFAVIEGLTITKTAGSFTVCEGTLIGIANAEAESDLETATYDAIPTVTYPSMKGASSLVIGSYQPQVQSLVISTGTVVQPLTSGNAADGHAGYRIVSRNPTAVLDARVSSVSDWDPRADKLARTTRTIDTIVGTVQYKRHKLDIDAAFVKDVQMKRAGGFVNYTVTYGITEATNTLSHVFD